MTDRNFRYDLDRGGGGGTPLCDLNRDVRPDRVWFCPGDMVVRMRTVLAIPRCLSADKYGFQGVLS